MAFIEKVLYGNTILSNVPVLPGNAQFALTGKDRKKNTLFWPVDQDTLSKHFFFLGAIGMGKSNAIENLISRIQSTMTQNDVMLIFDTKGDYLNSFYKPGDIVISNDNRATDGEKPDYWNLFREVTIDDQWVENATEIANTIFAERLEKTSQIFFPTAAKDLLTALILGICRNKNRPEHQNNKILLKMLQTMSSERMVNLLQQYPDLNGMISYIRDPSSGQTLGVISELQSAAREILVGNFAKNGTLSMRQIIRNKGSKTVFVEYDLGIGGVLTPIYRLLFDMAIKETLCRKRNNEGNVYFVIDEFSLLPHLKHIDDGVNFGRSLGAKFIIGAQNISQIYDAYGENRGNSLLSGFSTTVCFRVNDGKSREFFKELNGKNARITSFESDIKSRGQTEQFRETYVVEDHDIDHLDIGEALVHSGAYPPFRFKFDKYE